MRGFLNATMARGARPPGFTLVEILLAMGILAIVLSTIYAAWTGTLRIAREGDYADRVYAMARTAMRQLAEDLESLHPPGDSFIFQAASQNPWGNPLTELRFVSSRRLGLSRIAGGLQEISWFAIEDRDSGGILLMRRETLYQYRPEHERSRSPDIEGAYVVAEGLRSLRCLFVDNLGENHETWDSLATGGNQRGRAPSLITIHLDFDNPDDARWPWRFMTRVFIPQAPGGVHER